MIDALPPVSAALAVPDAGDGVAVLHVRGDLRRLTGAVAAIEAAVRAPAWAGHSLDALNDLLADLGWLPADGYLIVVPARHLLAGEDDETFAALVRVLASAAHAWGQQDPAWLPYPRPAKALRTVLTCDDGEALLAVQERLAVAGRDGQGRRST